MTEFVPITTNRLVIRGVEIDDVDDLHRRRNEPEVAEYQDWPLPYPLESARQLVVEAAAMAGPADGEWWMGTVVERANGTAVGDLAVKLESSGRAAIIGYTFASAHWGRGYATESVGALVDALMAVGVRRFTATIAPENTNSMRVVERLGFQHEGRTIGSWFHGDGPEAEAGDDVLYGLTAPARAAWLARPTGRPSTVELQEIDRSNYRAMEDLATHHSQRNLVAPVLDSFSDALFSREVDGFPTRPWMRAIAADDGRGGPVEPVGFVMLRRPERPDADLEPYLWRLLIDRVHQRRGIASLALDTIEDDLRTDGHRSVRVHWAEGPGTPAPFYQARGYEPTGKVEDGEIEGRKILTPDD